MRTLARTLAGIGIAAAAALTAAGVYAETHRVPGQP
jgi:hypothetical protein